MSGALHRYIRAAALAVERHGGGWLGLRAVCRRAFKVAWTIGPRGLFGRLRQAGATPGSLPPRPDHVFPAAAPLREVQLRVGLMAHVFYPDLIEEFARELSQMPLPYVLLVSVPDEATQRLVEQRFGALAGVERLVTRVVPNRGRDIAPLLIAFREEILALDLIGHIHTKKSLYTGGEQERWRRYLLGSLFGSAQRLAWIFGMFQAEPRLGMIYPESYPGMPLWGHTWLGNAAFGEQIAARLGFSIDRGAYIDFPAGSMFWARVSTLRPLYGLDFGWSDFPPEQGQTDGTLQHAIERILGGLVHQQGQLLGILPQDGALTLSTEGERNWRSAFEMPLAQRIQLSALDARLVSVDVFDTLVTRPFLTAEGARSHLDFLAAHRYAAHGFSAWRSRAESRARVALGRDPTLGEIYHAFAELRPGLPVADLERLEMDHERRMLRVREGVAVALAALGDKRVVAMSDMYLPSDVLRAILPNPIPQQIQEWWVSCETGRRKDEPDTWLQVAEAQRLNPASWLHIGDNERADVQIPQAQGMLTPVHVLRPSALLDVVPALRGLRHTEGSHAPWTEQLWRGLVANRFAALADRDPTRIEPLPRLDAESAGYIVLGPLVLDYALWLTRLAQSRGADLVLFLSREGYLLQQVFQEVMRHLPMTDRVDSRYLLVSRRATGLPTLRDVDDLPALLRGTFNGTLAALLEARLGEQAMRAARQILGNTLQREVFLPEMQAEVLALLAPTLPALLEIATEERQAYLEYWGAEVGDAEPIVADIGYAGSIQLNLSRLVGKPLGGAYFALRGTASQLEHSGWAEARHYDGRHDTGAGSEILRHDLLLEALLTAPDGQFCRFERRDGLVKPLFSPAELSERGRAVLAQVHQGALSFAADICAVVGEDILQLVAQDHAALTIPLSCLAEGRWQADEWLSELATEDAYTGRGRIAAAP